MPYAFHSFVRGLPDIIIETNALAERLAAHGRPVAAAGVRQALKQLEAELIAHGAKMAAKGTHILREHERTSRVRPDTLGHGGPRLKDFLDVEPLPILPGSIGIANEGKLDGGVPWWETNEWGSNARVGGHIFGQFFSAGFGASAAPSGGESRVHPIFSPSVESGSGPGVIRKPIPARRFIRDAIPEIDGQWKAGVDVIKANFVAELTFLAGQPV